MRRKDEMTATAATAGRGRMGKGRDGEGRREGEGGERRKVILHASC